MTLRSIALTIVGRVVGEATISRLSKSIGSVGAAARDASNNLRRISTEVHKVGINANYATATLGHQMKRNITDVGTMVAVGLSDPFAQMNSRLAQTSKSMKDVGDAAKSAKTGVDQLGNSASKSGKAFTDLVKKEAEAEKQSRKLAWGLRVLMMSFGTMTATYITAGIDRAIEVESKWYALASQYGDYMTGSLKERAAYAKEYANTLSKNLGVPPGTIRDMLIEFGKAGLPMEGPEAEKLMTIVIGFAFRTGQMQDLKRLAMEFARGVGDPEIERSLKRTFELSDEMIKSWKVVNENGETYVDIQKVIADLYPTMARSAAEFRETDLGKMMMAQYYMEKIQVILGAQILPAIMPIIEAIAQIAEAFSRLPDPIKSAIAYLLVFSAASSMFVGVTGFDITGMFADFIKGAKKAGGVTELLKLKWGGFKGGVKDGLKLLRGGFSGLGKGFTSLFGGLGSLGSLLSILMDPFLWILIAVVAIAGIIVYILWKTGAWKDILKFLQYVWEKGIYPIVKKVYDFLLKFADVSGKAIGGFLDQIAKFAKEKVFPVLLQPEVKKDEKTGKDIVEVKPLSIPIKITYDKQTGEILGIEPRTHTLKEYDLSLLFSGPVGPTSLLGRDAAVIFWDLWKKSDEFRDNLTQGWDGMVEALSNAWDIGWGIATIGSGPPGVGFNLGAQLGNLIFASIGDDFANLLSPKPRPDTGDSLAWIRQGWMDFSRWFRDFGKWLADITNPLDDIGNTLHQWADNIRSAGDRLNGWVSPLNTIKSIFDQILADVGEIAAKLPSIQPPPWSNNSSPTTNIGWEIATIGSGPHVVGFNLGAQLGNLIFGGGNPKAKAGSPYWVMVDKVPILRFREITPSLVARLGMLSGLADWYFDTIRRKNLPMGTEAINIGKIPVDRGVYSYKTTQNIVHLGPGAISITVKDLTPEEGARILKKSLDYLTRGRSFVA